MRQLITRGMVVTTSLIIFGVQTAGAGVLDSKDVRAWWKFETKNGGQPIGETVSPGDTIDDSSPNGISLEVMSPKPMEVVTWEGGKALLFDGKTTWLCEKGLLKLPASKMLYTENPPGIIDKGQDFSTYWAENSQATHIVVVEWGWAWGYIGEPASHEEKHFIPVYKNRALTQPGWNGRRIPLHPRPYEIRTAGFQFSNKFTLAAWFRIAKPEGNRNLISKNDYGGRGQRAFDFGVTHAQDTRLQLHGVTGTGNKPEKEILDENWVITGGGSVPQGAWQFVAVTFDGQEVCFYLNGQLTRKTKIPFPCIRDEAVPVTVGSNLCNGEGAAIFKGEIAEIVILGEVLKQSDIHKLYKANPIHRKKEEEQKQLDDLIKGLKEQPMK